MRASSSESLSALAFARRLNNRFDMICTHVRVYAMRLFIRASVYPCVRQWACVCVCVCVHICVCSVRCVCMVRASSLDTGINLCMVFVCACMQVCECVYVRACVVCVRHMCYMLIVCIACGYACVYTTLHTSIFAYVDGRCVCLCDHRYLNTNAEIY